MLIIVCTYLSPMPKLTFMYMYIFSQYGCVKGVYGTPFFFVNGFPLPDAGSPLDYKTWRNILDPLISPDGQLRTENLHFFL